MLQPRFVIQKHQSKRPHYDIRLERGAVLKSWALPKGMPKKINEKRLAVDSGDHHLSALYFQGMIPEGIYGAGKVTIVDTGTFVPLKWTKKEIKIRLDGTKYKGEYVFIDFSKTGSGNWLLMKLKNKKAV
jgi:bifunctional non-homologous end joining protein LigD